MPKAGNAAVKKFVDLHLCPRLENPARLKQMIEKAAELGYKTVGIPFPAQHLQENIKLAKKICNDTGVELVTRIDLSPNNPAELLKNLRKLRRKIEVIAAKCYSKIVARQAAKDRRVDILSFPSTSPRKRFFDSAEANLASKALAAFEIDMAPLLYLQGFRRCLLLSCLRKETMTATKRGVPLILSSGASDALLLRKPKDYAALTYLFDLDAKTAEQAVSQNPQAIIERNRRKLSPDYIAPDVYLVRRGKDCPSE